MQADSDSESIDGYSTEVGSDAESDGGNHSDEGWVSEADNGEGTDDGEGMDNGEGTYDKISVDGDWSGSESSDNEVEMLDMFLAPAEL